MPELEDTKRRVNDTRSVVTGAALLIDGVAAAIQTLVDRKAKVEDFQAFATALRTHRDQLATAVARNTAAESSGAAEPVPAEQSSVPPEEPAPPVAVEEEKKRRAPVRKAAKVAVSTWAAKRTVGAAKARRSK